MLKAGSKNRLESFGWLASFRGQSQESFSYRELESVFENNLKVKGII